MSPTIYDSHNRVVWTVEVVARVVVVGSRLGYRTAFGHYWCRLCNDEMIFARVGMAVVVVVAPVAAVQDSIVVVGEFPDLRLY